MELATELASGLKVPESEPVLDLRVQEMELELVSDPKVPEMELELDLALEMVEDLKVWDLQE